MKAKENVVLKENEIIQKKDEQLISLIEENQALKKQLADKTIENQLTKNAYTEIVNSHFWRMTLPIQNILNKIRHEDELKEVDNQTSHQEKKLIQKGDTVIILTPRYHFYCELLKFYLEEFGVKVKMIFSEPNIYSENLYFVVCSEIWNELPNHYIAIQLENLLDENTISRKYVEQLINSKCVLDYSTYNIQYFKNNSVNGNKFYYLPSDYLCAGIHSEYKNEIVCYSKKKVKRVEEIVKELSKCFNVKYLNEESVDLERELRNTKIIINLNCFDNSLLDSDFIYYALSKTNAVVFSERSLDKYEEDRLENIIQWFDCQDISFNIMKIKEYLNNNEELKKQKKLIKNNQFELYFYRFLLAFDCISFDEFYDRCSQYIHFVGNRICLSLPEDVDRRNAFIKDNHYGFTFFPGLRHTRGWTGCGMSYKFIMKKAKELGLDDLIVCEDDVLFPEDFKERFEKCLDYLHQKDDWDIFQGIMADVGDVTIKSVVEENKQKFVKLDHMMSMVFNVYKSTIFDYLIHWDETNDDLKTNTIDRALESKDLNVLTTIPFLAGHKEDLKSTIWGFNNTEYIDWIRRSSEKLEALVDEYLANQQKEGGSC